MPALPRELLVRLWERGLGLLPLERALLLARAAQPELDATGVAQLSLGARDALLFELRQQLFGVALPLYGNCPSCRIDLEVHVTVADVRAPAAPASAVFTIELAGLRLDYRVPRSADLLALSGRRSTERDLAAELFTRCIVAATRDDVVVDPRTLSAEVLDAVAAAMAEKDPQAEVLFDLQCPGCQKITQTTLDIGSYLWAELDVAIRRLLLDVHALARAYGWSESQVLALSNVRRQFYLDAIEAMA